MVFWFPIIGASDGFRSLEDAQKARAEADRLRTESSEKLMTSLRNAEVGRPGHWVRAKNQDVLPIYGNYHRKNYDWGFQVWSQTHSAQ
jgi:selenocysteine lyase/cysteine desulfurase